MKKLYFVIFLNILLTLNIFFYNYSASNFQLKNIGYVPVWFSLGNQQYDPMNFKLNNLNAGAIDQQTIDMKSYPQLLVGFVVPQEGDMAYKPPAPGDIVYYAVANPTKVKNIDKKKMLLTVAVRKDPFGVVYPEVAADPDYKNDANNIKNDEIDRFAVKYKQQAPQVDLVNNAYNFLHKRLLNNKEKNIALSASGLPIDKTPYDNYLLRDWDPLSPRSTSYEIFGVGSNIPKSLIPIVYQDALGSISYLKEQPDMIPLYNQIKLILDKAYSEINPSIKLGEVASVDVISHRDLNPHNTFSPHEIVIIRGDDGKWRYGSIIESVKMFGGAIKGYKVDLQREKKDIAAAEIGKLK